MMRILLDTNVVLDALLAREPWRADAEAIWTAHLDGRVTAHVTASSVTDVFYVARRLAGREAAWDAVRVLLDQLAVISVGAAELTTASIGTGDFEDLVQAACADAARLDLIVTRDPTGFPGGGVPAVDPPSFLRTLASGSAG